MKIELRHARQAKLRDVGAEGQLRIVGLAVHVGIPGVAGEVAARYLAGAGVGELSVTSTEQAAAARSVDARVAVSVSEDLIGPSHPRLKVGGTPRGNWDPLQAREAGSHLEKTGGARSAGFERVFIVSRGAPDFQSGGRMSFDDLDPAAREVARGAHFALVALRDALRDPR